LRRPEKGISPMVAIKKQALQGGNLGRKIWKHQLPR
jgi:hypothetical protein